MVSTLSFSSRVRLRRGRIEGEPVDRKNYFLYLNLTVKQVTTCKWDPRTYWEY